MNSNTDLLLLNFNIRLLGNNFDTFNCFTNQTNKKFDILSFSKSWLNDNSENQYTIEKWFLTFSPPFPPKWSIIQLFPPCFFYIIC